jgi:hypothetical protein
VAPLTQTIVEIQLECAIVRDAQLELFVAMLKTQSLCQDSLLIGCKFHPSGGYPVSLTSMTDFGTQDG